MAMAPEPLCQSLLAKIQEQIDRTAHLVCLVPANRVDWTPSYSGGWAVEALLGHLLECLAGFCAVLFAIEPERLAHFTALRSLKVNCACSPAETLKSIAVYRARIEEGFALLADSDLSKSVPTVFVEHGEPALTLLLGNLEHVVSHKHQLFTYLKEMGVKVGTSDLYHLRGSVKGR